MTPYLLTLCWWCIATGAVSTEAPLRPVSTYSIVAQDQATGQLGVAVQSHWFSVGSVVLWAEPGIGAVATQSFAEPGYGPLGLQLMRSGKTAQQALAGLVSADSNAESRQVGMVDGQDNVANFTGANAIAESCELAGDGFTVQANLMWKPSVCDAMAAAYGSAPGDLGQRLMAALDAAEATGGDVRGKQSAALLVVSGDSSQPPWAGRVYDLRVEDHPQPLSELRRLLVLNRAYNLMNEGDEHMVGGHIDLAEKAYSAAAALAPGSHEMVFWHAVTLAGAGQIERALPLFAQAFAAWPRWREVIPRLAAAGMLPDDGALLSRILAVP